MDSFQKGHMFEFLEIHSKKLPNPENKSNILELLIL